MTQPTPAGRALPDEPSSEDVVCRECGRVTIEVDGRWWHLADGIVREDVHPPVPMSAPVPSPDLPDDLAEARQAFIMQWLTDPVDSIGGEESQPSTDAVDALDRFIAVATESGEVAELRLIDDEVERASQRFGEWSTSGSMMQPAQRLAVLMEEVGEVAEAVVLSFDNGRFVEDRPGHADDLTRELVQVAAVCVGWLRALATPKPVEPGGAE